MANLKKLKAIKISQNHLLGIQDLTISDVKIILKIAKEFIKLNRSKTKKIRIVESLKLKNNLKSNVDWDKKK